MLSYTPIVCVFAHPVVTAMFSPQNYTVREAVEATLFINLSRPSVQDTTLNVATMHITATSE